MLRRTLALALPLFVLGCGHAAPAPSNPAPPPAPSATAVASATPSATASSEPAPAPSATPSASASADAAAPGDGKTDKKKKGDKTKGGKGKNAAVVDPMEPLSGGMLTQEDVRKILEKNGEIFDECYTIGAGSKTKSFTATVTIKATLGPSGSVNAAQVMKSTANNPKVDACVSQAFKKIKFPALKNGGTSVINFPIQFGGLEEVKN